MKVKLNQQDFYLSLKQCQRPQIRPFNQATEKTTRQRYIISLSGGLDSVVLLHLMQSLKKKLLFDGYRLAAIYVNHNLSPCSEQWAVFCQKICSDYDIPIQILSVNAQPLKRQSPEDAARIARYQALKQQLSSSDCLLTAHHQDDQGETILLQLFRGSGPKGLSAMPAYRQFYHLSLARPLLNYTREQIYHYALQNKLQWVEDESNQQQRFKRNFLRRSILPLLKQQWPGLYQTLFRASQIQGETVSILDEVAEQDLALCEIALNMLPVQKQNNCYYQPMLDVKQLKLLSPARIKNCLQFWLRKNNSNVLRSSLLDEFLHEFINKQATAKSQLRWKKSQHSGNQKQYIKLNYFQNKIYLCHHLTKNRDLSWSFREKKKLILHNLQIQSTLVEEADKNALHTLNLLSLNKLPEMIQIKFRQGGESYKKNDKSAHFSLKKWFQENSTPPWLRDHIPLFYINEELIQVATIIVNHSYVAKTNEPAIYFSLNQFSLN